MLLIQYTLIYASVLIFVAMGGMFSERSGVINLGLEGIMVMGALGGAFVLYTLPVGTPSLVIISLLAGAISSIDKYPLAQKALRGINVAVAALLTSVIVKFSKKTIKNIWNALFMLLSFVLIYFLKVQSVWIIIAALIIGSLLTLYKQKRGK